MSKENLLRIGFIIGISTRKVYMVLAEICSTDLHRNKGKILRNRIRFSMSKENLLRIRFKMRFYFEFKP